MSRIVPTDADARSWVPAVGRNGLGEPEGVVLKALPGPLAGTLADDPTDPSVAFMPGECRCCSWQHAPKDRAPEPIGPPTAWRPAHEQAEAHVRKLTK